MDLSTLLDLLLAALLALLDQPELLAELAQLAGLGGVAVWALRLVRRYLGARAELMAAEALDLFRRHLAETLARGLDATATEADPSKRVEALVNYTRATMRESLAARGVTVEALTNRALAEILAELGPDPKAEELGSLRDFAARQVAARKAA